jgi:hypothetical protein
MAEPRALDTTVAVNTPPFPAPAITPERLAAFAQLVGEPEPTVRNRLALDPGLLPFAVEAADERLRRKRSGKIRAIVGFGILGVGLIAGEIVRYSADGMACQSATAACDDARGERESIGLIIEAVAAGVGLGIGIPGLVRMGKQSEAEYVAVNRYLEPPAPTLPSARVPNYPARPLGRAFTVPILSLSF